VEDNQPQMFGNYRWERAAAGKWRKAWASQGALADRGMAANDPLCESLCPSESLHFNGFCCAEFPVHV
jgi:hypothetical protein